VEPRDHGHVGRDVCVERHELVARIAGRHVDLILLHLLQILTRVVLRYAFYF